ncbi:MAG: glycosyltransferase family 2 protein [Ferruginibacter sp.]|nr:glycosyltransferase family 2 protein [Ferruginibacter sp.]
MLLSICIPTFNRAGYLDICLNNFCREMKDAGDGIELIVTDNCSTDDTQETVRKYMLLQKNIQYHKNKSNLGADGNMLTCLEKANGEYCWIFGDDDILLEGQLKIILEQLSKKQFDLIYLGNYWFGEDYLLEKPQKSNPASAIVFEDKKAFLKTINIWTTFISAVIFKKQVVQNKDLTPFLGTNLIQLQWVLPSVFTEKKCLYLQGQLIACKGNNTGGYNLFKTFGTNLNHIVNSLIKQGLVQPYATDILNYYIIKDFMPLYCIRYKQKEMGNFNKEESPFIQLRKLYKKYFIYWIVLFPLDILPVFLGKKYYYGMKKLNIF